MEGANPKSIQEEKKQLSKPRINLYKPI